MALPCRQQRLLDAIDHQLTSADPRLAWLLGAFGRLWADEPLPAREQFPTWASRLGSFLWEALAVTAWPMPLMDPSVTDAAGHPGAGHGSVLPPDRGRQSPDWPGRSGRHGPRPRGSG